MSTKRVLLIQTEQVERERLARLLEPDCDTIVQANNGAEGLSLFRQSTFDLVITDDEMPFLKGSELARQVKSMSPWQPVLMLSNPWRRPGPENPVDASLLRSCNPARLRQVVDSLLAKPEPARADETNSAPATIDDFELAEA